MTATQNVAERVIEDRVVRVFVSSTFADMQSEREELVKKIFPQVQCICESRTVGWSYVDLRWGIPEELIADGALLPLCFAEIDRCRPFFIGILGERDGTVPTVPGTLLEHQPWIQDYRSASVTELEIRHGVLNHKDDGQPIAFFYFRVPAVDVVEPMGGRMGLLKREIASQAHLKLRTYDSAEQLGKLVLDDLSRAIECVFPDRARMTPDERERSGHLHYAKRLSKGYVERPDYLEQLAAHAAGSYPPLVVFGPPGSGKSSLLARWVLQGTISVPVVYHFAGAASRSTQWRSMATRIMDELRRALRMNDATPEDSPQLPAVFEAWLGRAALTGPFVLVVDGIDELDYGPEDLEHGWLPRHVPSSARLVISTASPHLLDKLTRQGWSVLKVSPLDPAERRQVMSTYLGEYGKRLTELQDTRIANTAQCANALYLSVLLGELTGQSDPVCLEQAINVYLAAPDIPQLLQKVLERWEADYDGPRNYLVRDALSFVCTARRGVSESELLDLLGSDGNPLPKVFWLPFRSAIDHYLTEKQGLLCPLHREFRKAVTARYLDSDEALKLAARTLAEYLTERAAPTRAADEVPWLLCDAGKFETAANRLAAPEFLDIVWRQSRMELLSLWRRIERHSSLTVLTVYSQALTRLEDYPAIEALGWLFSHTGHLREGISLRKVEADFYRRTGNDNGLSLALGELSVDAFVYGDVEVALEACQEHLALAERLGDPFALQQAHGNLGNILMYAGQYEEALRHYDAQERLCVALHHTWGLHSAFGNKAKVWLLQGDRCRALSLYRLDEDVCRSLGDQLALALCQDNQASILAADGRLEEALRLAQNSEKTLREIGSLEDLQTNLALQGSVLSHTDLPKALCVYRKAEAALAGCVSNRTRSEFYIGMGASLLNALGQMCASGRMELDEYQKHVEALSQRQNYLEAANCAMAKAAALAPDDANVAFLAGIAAEDGGLREDAIRHFERALMLRPDWEEVELRLGGLLIEDAK